MELDRLELEAQPQKRIIIPLDRPDMAAALALAETVGPSVGAFKVGLELFTSEGPDAIRQIVRLGHRVFYDSKFHDIPNTVAGACRAAVRTGAWMLNIHAPGGRVMLEAAVEAVREESDRCQVTPPILIGVTVLTSLDEALLREAYGVSLDLAELVLCLAELCQDCGLDGVVASPQEARAIRTACGPDFVIVTPGIRRAGGAIHDQKRSATPAAAVAAGADYLVIGRDITAAADPARAAREVAIELKEAAGN